jgi:hypothetical protein
MRYFCKQSIVRASYCLLVFLAGCNAKPECDSFETRDAVLKSVSDDHDNALGKYAAKAASNSPNSHAGSEAEKINRQRPLYILGEKIVTTSTSADKTTLKCSGAISVTVADTKATKEIDFSVQRSSNGKISVSITPFEFDWGG